MVNANKPKEKLYRKENKRALHYRGPMGGDFRHSRHNKKFNENLHEHSSMKSGVQWGVDYTPLFKFLLSKVGCNWDDVYSEAISRIDKAEPIFWLVALEEDNKKTKIRVGESTYYSGLYVDENNLLQKVTPVLNLSELYPACPCCTHTFNGKVFTKTYQDTIKNFAV